MTARARYAWIGAGAVVGAVALALDISHALAQAPAVGPDIVPMSWIGFTGLGSLVACGVLFGKQVEMGHHHAADITDLQSKAAQIVPRAELDARLERIETKVDRLLDRK
jgi:hypothetical protein